MAFSTRFVSEALDQFWVADRDRRPEGCDPPEWVMVMASQDVGGGRGEVDGLALQLLRTRLGRG